MGHGERAGRYEHVRRDLYRLHDYPGSSHEEVRAKWLAVGAERAVTRCARSSMPPAPERPPEQIEMAVRQALGEGLATGRSFLARASRRGGRAAGLVRRAAEKDRLS
jgi:hypothetical protein